MQCQGGQTSIELRKLILFHYQEGKSLREIGTIVNRSHSKMKINVIYLHQMEKSVSGEILGRNLNKKCLRTIIKHGGGSVMI